MSAKQTIPIQGVTLARFLAISLRYTIKAESEGKRITSGWDADKITNWIYE
jgi:hypothetical protein